MAEHKWNTEMAADQQDRIAIVTGASSGIGMAAAHPGWTATELQRNSSLTSALNHIFAQTTEMGALPTLYAATAPDVKGADFYGPDGFKEMKGYPKKVESVALSHDPEIAERLWQVSETLTGVKYLLPRREDG